MWERFTCLLFWCPVRCQPWRSNAVLFTRQYIRVCVRACVRACVCTIPKVLSRRTKSNPVLIGEAGVGKTSVVEGLAQRIYDREVSASILVVIAIIIIIIIVVVVVVIIGCLV